MNDGDIKKVARILMPLIENKVLEGKHLEEALIASMQDIRNLAHKDHAAMTELLDEAMELLEIARFNTLNEINAADSLIKKYNSGKGGL